MLASHTHYRRGILLDLDERDEVLSSEDSGQRSSCRRRLERYPCTKKGHTDLRRTLRFASHAYACMYHQNQRARNQTAFSHSKRILPRLNSISDSFCLVPNVPMLGFANSL